MRTARWLVLGGSVVVIAALAAYSSGLFDGARPAGFCASVERVGAQHEADITDADAIGELVRSLPRRLKGDAALFYHPYGGSVQGLNTSGENADAAGRRLYAYYADACDYEPDRVPSG